MGWDKHKLLWDGTGQINMPMDKHAYSTVDQESKQKHAFVPD